MRRNYKKTKEKNIIVNYINNNIKEYTVITIVFFIGLILGVFVINNATEAQEGEIVGYINQFIQSLKLNNTIDKLSLLKQIVLENLGLVLILWFAGGTVIGIPIVYGVIIFRGFCLGYTISTLLASLRNKKWNDIFYNYIRNEKYIFYSCDFNISS